MRHIKELSGTVVTEHNFNNLRYAGDSLNTYKRKRTT